MDKDTVKLIRIPAYTWRAVVAALERVAAREDEHPTLPRDMCNAPRSVKAEWHDGYREDFVEARSALVLARKVKP